ncbi:MAG: glycogen synthase [Acidobacteria bacterium]|nr:glycogen synthase [Acidobacteriota bacterium]
MHIVHIAPEMAPFVKIGGLGDVVGALPPAQARDGHQVTVVLPGYARVLGALGLAGQMGQPVSYRVDGYEVGGTVHTIEHHGVTVLLVAQADFFGRPEVYGGPEGGYLDNGLRFGWFSGAALSALRGREPAPDAVVAHDWPAALSPVFQRAHRMPNDPLERTASAVVIHNLAHQGVFPFELARRFSLPHETLHPGALESLGWLNYLKGAIAYATTVITVSPNYAQEILWGGYSEGLEQTLRARAEDLVGILNGVDTEAWDPAHDVHLARRYDAGDLAGKLENKLALQRELGLREDPRLPLFSMIGRLDHQKGVDLLEAAAPGLVDREAQVVLLGAGPQRLVDPLIGLSRIWRQSVAIVRRFDDPLAHRIYAGSDFFLMPSRFEPCGLGQMIALRYGTIPIVRRTGGLVDTVRDIDEHPATGNGFVFNHADANGLAWACGRALRALRDRPELLAGMQRRAMEEDHSWDRSARTYDEVLEQAVQKERQRTTV